MYNSVSSEQCHTFSHFRLKKKNQLYKGHVGRVLGVISLQGIQSKTDLCRPLLSVGKGAVRVLPVT